MTAVPPLPPDTRLHYVTLRCGTSLSELITPTVSAAPDVGLRDSDAFPRVFVLRQTGGKGPRAPTLARHMSSVRAASASASSNPQTFNDRHQLLVKRRTRFLFEAPMLMHCKQTANDRLQSERCTSRSHTTLRSYIFWCSLPLLFILRVLHIYGK